jgi:hypothetical protein
MPAEQAVLPQVGLPVLFEGLSATTQYFEQTYNRGKSILEDTLTAFKQDKEAGPSRLKQSERLMHQFRAEKDKAAAFAWAEVANAKRFANDLSVVETRCEQLSTINHQLSSQVSTLETQRAAFDRLTEGEIAELQGAKAKCIVSMRRLFGRGVRLWKRLKRGKGRLRCFGMRLRRHRRLSRWHCRATKAKTLLAKVSGTRSTRSKSF